MKSSELLVILVVALLAFGPAKLPLLASHLGRLFFQINRLKQQAAQFWQSQSEALQLTENQRKAAKADEIYQGGKRISEHAKYTGDL